MTKLRSNAWILLLFGALSVIGLQTRPAVAQQTSFQNALLDHLVGHWIAQGNVTGSSAVHDIDAAWVMGHQYLRVHEVAHEKNLDGSPSYEATVYIGWDTKKSQYQCIWLDTFGGVAPGSRGVATPGDNQIPFVFPEPGGSFHTTFIYDPKSDAWKWQLDSEQGGKVSPFARFALTRQK